MTAISSTYGRITKILVFISDPDADPVKAAIKKYSEVFDAFDPSVHFYIVVAYNNNPNPGNVRDSHPVIIDNKTFIVLDPQMDAYHWIPEWAQDHVTALNENGTVKLQLHPAINKVTRDKIKSATGFDLSTAIHCMASDGGNVLVGQQDGKPFLLVGKYLRPEDKGDLGKQHGIETVIDMDFAFPGEIEEIFFHLDLYVTLAGRLSGNEQETFFLAKKIVPMGPNSNNEMLKKITEEMDRVKTWLNRALPTVRIIPLPLLVLNLNETFVGSYNNCLVENYGNRVVMYLPDYSRAAYRILYELPNDEFRKLFGSIKSMRKVTMDTIVTQINDLQTNIKHRLETHYGVTEVKLVDGSFHDSITERGSLHCFLKVIERV